jgi:hypothetical protein
MGRQRDRNAFEYELLDTGTFDENRYFDVFVEYAKNAPEDILIRDTVHNRGPEPAKLHLLPTLWFRNTWAAANSAAKPVLRRLDRVADGDVIVATHPELGDRLLYVIL